MSLFSFMNTPDEWHSFVIGFFEVVCYLPRKIKPLEDRRVMVSSEYWYYMFGRGMGWVAFLLGSLGIARLGLWIFA